MMSGIARLARLLYEVYNVRTLQTARRWSTLSYATGDNVTILATGGTIATVTNDGGGTSPALTGDELASAVRPLVGDDRELHVEEFSKLPSWAMTTRDMLQIALRARELTARSRHGVVVTHGTTTMEFTAWLTDLFLSGTLPVVFTGAMRRADEPDSDGLRNLSDAIRVAASTDARGMGAMVCFAGEIFAARDVWKRDRSSTAPYASDSGPIGYVDNSRIAFGRRPFRPRIFRGRIDPAVALVKAFPDCTGVGVEAAVDEGARGIVLEGLPGSGGLPPKMQPAVARVAAEGVVMVLSSSARSGRIFSTSGGTGEPLANIGLVSAGSLPAEKAWVLLMVALAESSEIDGVQRIFDEFSSEDGGSPEERRSNG